MADDIDIENHELIDNPQIKHVFPHFEDIKHDILDYGVDVPERPENDHDDVAIGQVSGTLMPTPNGGVIKDEPTRDDQIILLADSDDDIDEKPILPAAQSEDDDINDDTVICINKIILGTKKSKDIHYCIHCNIFFGSKGKLDNHNRLKHKRINNRIKVGKKNSFKSVLSDMGCESFDDFENCIIGCLYDRIDDDEYYSCIHCDGKFLSKQAVVEHLHTVIQNRNGKGITKIASETQKNLRKKRKRDKEIDNKINKRGPKPKKSKQINYNLKTCYVSLNRDIKLKGNKHKRKEYNLKPCSVVLNKVNLKTINAHSRRNAKNDEKIEVMGAKCSDDDDFSVTSDDDYKADGSDDDNDEVNDSYEEEDNDNSKSELNQNESEKYNKTYFKCILCTCYFNEKNKTAFNKHMKVIHSIKTPNIKKCIFNPLCPFCDVNFASIIEYNRHIKKYRSTHINKNCDRNKFKYIIHRCLICDEEFTSKRLLYRHKARKHDKFQKGFRNEIVTNKDHFDRIYYKDNPLKFSNRTAFGGDLNPPVPRDVLFRCALCSCHFINAKAAKVHYGNCMKGLSGSRKFHCLKCDLDFSSQTKSMHLKQHEFTHKFRVYEIDEYREKFLDQILCLCPKCGIHYGETRFWKHYPICGKTPLESKYCIQCEILVDGKKKQIKNHVRKHDTVKQFIFMEFIEVQLSEDEKHEEMSRDKIIQKNYFMLFYCKNCKSFVRNVGGKQLLAHSDNRCKKLPKKMCKECGLVLTVRAYQTHKLHHKWKELKLLDYTFYDYHTNECIDPPFPQFPYCKQCKTYFEDINIIMHHKCDEINREKCVSCDKKFTAQAHKLHMFYHDYRNNKKKRLMIDDDDHRKQNLKNNVTEHSNDDNHLETETISGHVIYNDELNVIGEYDNDVNEIEEENDKSYNKSVDNNDSNNDCDNKIENYNIRDKSNKKHTKKKKRNITLRFQS